MRTRSLAVAGAGATALAWLYDVYAQKRLAATAPSDDLAFADAAKYAAAAKTYALAVPAVAGAVVLAHWAAR